MLAPLPSTDRISTDNRGTLSQWYQSWFSSIQYYLSAVGNNGVTAKRPTTGLYVGYPFYDTTLQKPIWWNGSTWKDATGAAV